MPTMTRHQWLTSAYCTWKDHYERQGIRWGQHLWNTLVVEHPQLAREMRRQGVDPFYDNAKVPKFLHYTRTHWNSTYYMQPTVPEGVSTGS